jgi:ribosomal protein S18 acetylase RimI-like enzyme
VAEGAGGGSAGGPPGATRGRSGGRWGGVVVRPARRNEIPAVLALWREAGAVPGVSDDPVSLARLLDTSEEALLVAETAGTPPAAPGGRPVGEPAGPLLGTIIAGWDGWRGNLYRLAVRPSARRRGIARLLVAEAERRLAAKGAGRLSALVMSDHDPAVALWLAAGYRPDPRVDRFVRTLPSPGPAPGSPLRPGAGR